MNAGCLTLPEAMHARRPAPVSRETVTRPVNDWVKQGMTLKKSQYFCHSSMSVTPGRRISTGRADQSGCGRSATSTLGAGGNSFPSTDVSDSKGDRISQRGGARRGKEKRSDGVDADSA